MLPPGHLGATFILIKIAEAAGGKFSLAEVVLALTASLVLDFDLVPAQLLRKNHHELISHTPLGAFILWLIFIFIGGSYLPPTGQILILFSLILHLLLDETGFWLCKIGWQEVSREPQINWLYPLTKFGNHRESLSLNAKFLLHYFQKARASVSLEIILSLTALLMLWLV